MPHTIRTSRESLLPAERVYRWVEYVALFFLMPLLFCFRSVHVPLPFLLMSAALICGFMLRGDRSFDRSQLWNLRGFRRGLPGVIGLWAAGTAVLVAGILVIAPERFLDFPRENPALWFAVMILYPLVSVYPQNVVYRVFIFHRYEALFKSPAGVVWASAAAFCFGHIIFQNWLAIGLTLAGGLIFARTYAKYRSGLLVSTEHALFGCAVFTVGLGKSLYLAAVQRAAGM